MCRKVAEPQATHAVSPAARSVPHQEGYWYGCGLVEMQSLSGRTGLSRSAPLWLIALAVICGSLGILFMTSQASAGQPPVTPGEYQGSTNQLCPQFAITAGLCKELERLPMSFIATRTRITAIKATVAEQCEDDLPPRLMEIELHRSYKLHWEGQDRAYFNLTSGTQRNQASGFVRRQVANGGLSVVSKDPEDPSHEAYCYGGGAWRATPK